jgi:vacuolar protein sorting-associated protein 54
MLADAEYFNSRISKLEGAGDLGSYLVDVVRNKTLVGGLQQSQSEVSENGSMSPKKDNETAADINGEQVKT